MNRLTPSAVALALPFSLFSTALLADVTPTQVWSDWQNYMQSVGYKLEANQTTSGGDITVSDMNLSFAGEDGLANMKMTIGTVDFKQNADGTVSIVLPDSFPITTSQKSNNALTPDVDITINVSQSGHSMIASGAPEEMTYSYAADTFVMDLDQTTSSTVEGAPDDTAKMQFSGTTVSNVTTMSIGETRGYRQIGSVAQAAYSMMINTSNDGGQNIDVSGTLSGVSINGDGTLPVAASNSSNISALISEGFDIKGNIAYSSGSANMAVKAQRGGDVQMQTSSSGGALNVAVGPNGVAYSGGQTNLQLSILNAGLPFPFEAGMAQSAFNIAIPIQKSEEPQGFALGLTMDQFTMSDTIWGIFDRTNQLPRDPATIELDLTGKTTILVDITDPEAAAQLGGAPGRLEAITLNKLLVAALGARLEGTGDISFNGAAPSPLPGIGSPVGAISLALAGGNGLLDKLSAAGLLPAEQAMGARMMLGVFAVPGTTPDSLNSRIEFTQDGQILANGQRIR